MVGYAIYQSSLPPILTLFINHPSVHLVLASGRDRHTRMWAHLMSRDLVAAIFSVTQSSCPSCKRKNAYCAALKVFITQSYSLPFTDFCTEKGFPLLAIRPRTDGRQAYLTTAHSS